jgi:hypothetical protein
MADEQVTGRFPVTLGDHRFIQSLAVAKQGIAVELAPVLFDDGY